MVRIPTPITGQATYGTTMLATHRVCCATLRQAQFIVSRGEALHNPNLRQSNRNPMPIQSKSYPFPIPRDWNEIGMGL
ncbi:MAG TPA: hypothetical protein PLE74_13250, partial [Candidatus Cloacimonadota bacterium]|nr:hypothetical protein [Candidatus Cloacimonadota bacterium]